MSNHYPLIGRKVPASCNDPFGTADPHSHIECPKCRKRLEAKVAAELAEAALHKPGSQYHQFHTGSAANIQTFLDRPAEGLSDDYLARVGIAA